VCVCVCLDAATTGAGTGRGRDRGSTGSSSESSLLDSVDSRMTEDVTSDRFTTSKLVDNCKLINCYVSLFTYS